MGSQSPPSHRKPLRLLVVEALPDHEGYSVNYRMPFFRVMYAMGVAGLLVVPLMGLLFLWGKGEIGLMICMVLLGLALCIASGWFYVHEQTTEIRLRERRIIQSKRTIFRHWHEPALHFDNLNALHLHYVNIKRIATKMDLLFDVDNRVRLTPDSFRLSAYQNQVVEPLAHQLSVPLYGPD